MSTSKENPPSQEKTFDEFIESCIITPWKTIAVCVDNSYVSAMVFERALKLAEFSCSRLHVLHVIPVNLPYAQKSEIAIEPGISEYMRQESEDMFRSIRKRLEERRVSGETVLLEGDPAEEILTFIRENKIELVILGSKEKLHTNVFLGSVSSRVSEEASSSVLIERIQ